MSDASGGDPRDENAQSASDGHADASPVPGESGPSTPTTPRSASFLPSADNIASATSSLLSSLTAAPSAILSLYSSSPPSVPPAAPPPLPAAQPSALRGLIAPHAARVASLTASAAPNVLAVPRHLLRGSTAPDELARAARVFAGAADAAVPRTEASIDRVVREAAEAEARWEKLVVQGGKEVDELGRALDYSGRMWPAGRAVP
ncbi:hypothetical protein DFJ74DRAFT_706124 [Hyaloraphidium curvatum]|nr:hypothetical protein DFJ74DRAFT_706124 [Hyaloraphidium curvatum]